MKLLFAADLHMDPLIWRNLPNVLNDSHDSWKQIVKQAIERKVDAVILGGDVFDRHPPSETVRCFLEGVWKLKHAQIPILAIQGQHGRSHKLAWSSLDPYVQDLDAATFVTVPLNATATERDFRIAGIDNLPPAQLKERLSALKPEVNVLVVHQMIRGMVPSFGGREIWDMDPDWVPNHVKLVLAGDYHSPVARTFKGIKFKYNGSTVTRSIDEPDEKFFHIVDDDFGIEPVKLSTRTIKRYLLMSDTDVEEVGKVLAELPLLPDGAVAYIRHHPRISNLETCCRAANPKVNFLFRPMIIRTEMVKNEAAPVAKVSLRGCLDRLLEREKDPFLYDFIVDLLASESPAETVAVHRHRCLEVVNADVPKIKGPELLPAPEPGH
jgi:DNA repair exonuclease SbcCD nuclease subunit